MPVGGSDGAGESAHRTRSTSTSLANPVPTLGLVAGYRGFEHSLFAEARTEFPVPLQLEALQPLFTAYALGGVEVSLRGRVEGSGGIGVGWNTPWPLAALGWAGAGGGAALVPLIIMITPLFLAGRVELRFTTSGVLYLSLGLGW